MQRDKAYLEIVHNFATYTKWPSNVLPPDDSPFVFGVLGDDDFLSNLEQFTKSSPVYKHVLNHKIVATLVADAKGAERCHLLYVGDAGLSLWARISDGLQERSVLTVSEAPQFHKRGGIIKLDLERTPGKDTGNPRWYVNNVAAKRAKLNISSTLLLLAKNRDEILGPK